MNDFIKQQQELAREMMQRGFFSNEPITALELQDKIITQTITNTGEELMRLAESKYEKGYLAHTYKAVGRSGKFIDVDTLKKHITKLTGVE